MKQQEEEKSQAAQGKVQVVKNYAALKEGIPQYHFYINSTMFARLEEYRGWLLSIIEKKVTPPKEWRLQYLKKDGDKGYDFDDLSDSDVVKGMSLIDLLQCLIKSKSTCHMAERDEPTHTRLEQSILSDVVSVVLNVKSPISSDLKMVFYSGVLTKGMVREIEEPKDDVPGDIERFSKEYQHILKGRYFTLLCAINHDIEDKLLPKFYIGPNAGAGHFAFDKKLSSQLNIKSMSQVLQEKADKFPNIKAIHIKCNDIKDLITEQYGNITYFAGKSVPILKAAITKNNLAGDYLSPAESYAQYLPEEKSEGKYETVIGVANDFSSTIGNEGIYGGTNSNEAKMFQSTNLPAVITDFNNAFPSDISSWKFDASKFKFVPNRTMYRYIFQQLYFEVSERNLHICDDGITDIENDYRNLVINYDFIGHFKQMEI